MPALILRQGSCELYTFGWGFGAASPPQTPTIGEVWRGPTTLWVPPPHLPNCKADRCQAKPCLSANTSLGTSLVLWHDDQLADHKSAVGRDAAIEGIGAGLAWFE